MSLFFISGREAQQTITDALSAPTTAPPPPQRNALLDGASMLPIAGPVVDAVRAMNLDLQESLNAVRRGVDTGMAGTFRLAGTFANLPNNALSDNIDFSNQDQRRTALSQWFEDAANDLMRLRATLVPTRQLSESQKIISGVAETLTPAIIGGGAAGPGGAAFALGSSSYERTRADLEAQGVDSVTAQNAGIQDALQMSALAAVPGAAGSSRWLRAVTGGTFNVGIGAGMRYNTARLLRERGHPELARQYRWADTHQAAIDAIVGAAFGAVHGGEHPPERVVQAALDVQDNIQRQTAFGVPTTPEAARWGSEALTRMEEQAANDEPIDPGEVPEGVDFVPLEQFQGLTPEQHLDEARQLGNDGEYGDALAHAYLAQLGGADGAAEVVRMLRQDASPEDQANIMARVAELRREADPVHEAFAQAIEDDPRLSPSEKADARAEVDARLAERNLPTLDSEEGRMLYSRNERGSERFWDDRLTAGENKAVEMRRNGFSNAEIADEMDSSANAIAVLLNKAKNKGVQFDRARMGRPASVRDEVVRLSQRQADGSTLSLNQIVARLHSMGFERTDYATVRELRRQARIKGHVLPVRVIGRYAYKPKSRGTGAEGNPPITSEQGANQEGTKYSRTERGGASTVEDLQAVASEFMGADWNALADAGHVQIVQSAADVPTGPRGLPGNVAAVHMRDSRTTYFIADKIRPERMRALILHEIGVHHGMEDLVGKRGMNALFRQLDLMYADKHPEVVRARDMAERYAARPDDVPEETLAYLIENNADLPIVTRTLSAVRQWLIKTFGTTFGMRLTLDDIRGLAITALRRNAERARREASPEPYVLDASPAYSQQGNDGGRSLSRPQNEFDTPFFTPSRTAPSRPAEPMAEMDWLQGQLRQFRQQQEWMEQAATRQARFGWQPGDRLSSVQLWDRAEALWRAGNDIERRMDVLRAQQGIPTRLDEAFDEARQDAADGVMPPEMMSLPRRGTVIREDGSVGPLPLQSAHNVGQSSAENLNSAGHALDMSEPARMARARAQGFDVDGEWYHGTQLHDGADIESFDLSRVGQGKGTDAERAIWFSDEPANVRPYAKTSIYSNAAVYPVYVRGRMLRFDAEGRTYDWSGWVTDTLEKARADGYDGVIFQNMHEPIAGGGDQLAVFDPRNVRSKFANFAPGTENSALLNPPDPAAKQGNSTNHDFPKFSVNGRDEENLLRGTRDPIESPDYQARLAALRGEDRQAAREPRDVGSVRANLKASEGRTGGGAENVSAPEGQTRAELGAVTGVSGIHLETKKVASRATYFGKYRATIDTPEGAPAGADALLRGQKTGVDFDLIDGSDPKETRLPGVHIRLTGLADEARGKGVGVWLYRQIVDWADRQGLPVYSDFSISPEAQNIYPALERRGYRVEQIAPFARDVDGGIVNVDFKPIFRISRTGAEDHYESAPPPREDYQIDGPTLRERIQVVEEARAREEAYHALSPAEQAIADDPKMLFSVNRPEDGKSERISARDLLARTEEDKTQAAEMSKAFEAAARCAARNAATQVLRSVPTAASFVTLRATAAAALPSADAAIGQVLGLSAAIPLGITGAPVILNASRRASAPGSYLDQLEQSTLPLSQQRAPSGSNDERFPVANPGDTLDAGPSPQERQAVARSYGASPAEARQYAQGEINSDAPPLVNYGPPDEQTGILPGPNVDVHVAPAENPHPAPAEDTGAEAARLLTEFLQSGKPRQ